MGTFQHILPVLDKTEASGEVRARLDVDCCPTERASMAALKTNEVANDWEP